MFFVPANPDTSIPCSIIVIDAFWCFGLVLLTLLIVIILYGWRSITSIDVIIGCSVRFFVTILGVAASVAGWCCWIVAFRIRITGILFFILIWAGLVRGWPLRRFGIIGRTSIRRAVGPAVGIVVTGIAVLLWGLAPIFIFLTTIILGMILLHLV